MGSIWISDAEIAALPAEGTAFDAVKACATSAWPKPDIKNQDSAHDVCALAGALIYKRLKEPTMLSKTQTALKGVIGTEEGARSLAIGRNLLGYVLAADIIDYADNQFVLWLKGMMLKKFESMTLAECHEKRANNWGTHAGSSRLAASIYLKNLADQTKAVTVWRGWLGDRNAYAGFKYGTLSWQADPQKPVGINPKGSLKSGHSIDGVLPDDQRRAGGFTWPPPAENYVRGALGAVLCAMEMMRRIGVNGILAASDEAPKRAIQWFEKEAKGKFSGDDGWIPPLARHLYPGVTTQPGDPKSKGKHMAWTAWTHP